MSRSRGRRGRQDQPFYAQPEPYDRQQAKPISRGVVIDLGDIGGQERPPVTASFRYFGETIRVNPELTEIVLMDFFDEADKVGKTDPRAMSIMKQFARDTIHSGDWETFWTLHKAHGQDTEDLMKLLMRVLEGVTSRPTGPPSGSSDGRTETNNASPVTSSLQGADQSRREAFLQQVERFNAMGTGNGAAMAAQVVAIARSQGIELDDDLIPERVLSGSPTA